MKGSLINPARVAYDVGSSKKFRFLFITSIISSKVSLFVASNRDSQHVVVDSTLGTLGSYTVSSTLTYVTFCVCLAARFEEVSLCHFVRFSLVTA